MDNRITLQKLEVFALVVELGNVSRVAERLYVAQPVVTGHIRSLEGRIGAPLLTREKGRMVPTAAGRRVYAWAAETLNRGDELTRELAGIDTGQAGSAIISTSISFGSYVLPEILRPFIAERPEARVSVRISGPEDAIARVLDGRSDFAITVGDEAIGTKGIDATLLYGEPLVLISAPHSPWTSVDVGALADLPFVCTIANSYRREITDRALRTNGIVRRRILLEFEHPEPIKNVVRSGDFLAFLLRSSVEDDVRRGVLQYVEIRGFDEPKPVNVYLSTRAGKSLSSLQRELIDTIQAHYQA